MIVCLCRAKTDRDVQAALEEGAASLRDLQKCGVGTDCGSCHATLDAMLAEHALPGVIISAAACRETRRSSTSSTTF